MDTASWIVATLFGAVIGTGLTRFPQERRVVLGAIAAMFVIGVVTWIARPASIAGPSLTVGGAACAGAMVFLKARGVS
jgi:hypothetical protein